MLVFPLPSHRALLPARPARPARPAGLDLGRLRLGRFPDGELRLELEDDPDGRDCALLGSLAPPDEQTLATLLLADTLRRAGARRVTAVLPYLGYARQDRAPRGRSLGAAWAGELLRAAGADEVVTVDVHSAAATACVPLPLTSLSPAEPFAAHLRQHGPLDGLTIVAPDEGARERCQAVADAAGIAAPVAYLRKRRTETGVAHRELVGEVGPRAAIVDDILDTGGTLLSACDLLRAAGVQRIEILATHGTLSGERWRELPAAGAARIALTDTIPGVAARAQGVAEILPIGPLLLGALSSPGAPAARPASAGA